MALTLFKLRIWLPIFLVGFLLSVTACTTKQKFDPAKLQPIEERVDWRAKWSTLLAMNLTHQFRIFPHLIDGRDMYAVSQSGELLKLSLAEDNIELVYRIDLQREIYASPTINDQRLYLCVSGEQLLVLSSVDGSVLESMTLASHCVAPPVLYDSRMFLRLVDGTLVAYDEQYVQQWSHSQAPINLSLDGNSPLLLLNESLFFATDDSKLFSLSPDDGEVYWAVNVGIPNAYSEIDLILDIDAPPAVWGKYLIVSAYQGRILMVNSLTGRQIWEKPLSTRTGVFVSEEQDKIWMSDINGVLHCLEAGSGNLLWSVDVLSHRILSRPVLINDLVVVADRFGYIHTFAADNGDYLGQERIKILRTQRDSRKKKHLRGRYTRKYKQIMLTRIEDDLFVAQDLSGRLVFYQPATH